MEMELITFWVRKEIEWWRSERNYYMQKNIRLNVDQSKKLRFFPFVTYDVRRVPYLFIYMFDEL